MKYKIKRAFGAYFNFRIDDVIEFSDSEALRYSHLIEPIRGEFEYSMNKKPNKKNKRGRRKTK